jgi:hypothetical protein
VVSEIGFLQEGRQVSLRWDGKICFAHLLLQ